MLSAEPAGATGAVIAARAGISTADASQPARAPAGGTGQGQQAEAGTKPEPDPAVTAEAAGTVLAIGRTADEPGKALASGNLDSAARVPGMYLGPAGLRCRRA